MTKASELISESRRLISEAIKNALPIVAWKPGHDEGGFQDTVGAYVDARHYDKRAMDLVSDSDVLEKLQDAADGYETCGPINLNGIDPVTGDTFWALWSEGHGGWFAVKAFKEKSAAIAERDRIWNEIDREMGVPGRSSCDVVRIKWLGTLNEEPSTATDDGGTSTHDLPSWNR